MTAVHKGRKGARTQPTQAAACRFVGCATVGGASGSGMANNHLPAPPRSQPVLLLLKGHPASGKTSLARQIARDLGWCIVDKDDAKDCFVGPLRGCCSDAQLNVVSYDVMFRVASTQLSCGNSVVVDCPLARRQLYEQATELAEQCAVVARTAQRCRGGGGVQGNG